MIERNHLKDESGQTMAEYGVVLTVVTIACLGALALAGSTARDQCDRPSRRRVDSVLESSLITLPARTDDLAASTSDRL